MIADNYRGFQIVQVGVGNFVIWKGGQVVTRSGSYFSAIAFIDEFLSH